MLRIEMQAQDFVRPDGNESDRKGFDVVCTEKKSQ